MFLSILISSTGTWSHASLIRRFHLTHKTSKIYIFSDSSLAVHLMLKQFPIRPLRRYYICMYVCMYICKCMHLLYSFSLLTSFHLISSIRFLLILHIIHMAHYTIRYVCMYVCLPLYWYIVLISVIVNARFLLLLLTVFCAHYSLASPLLYDWLSVCPFVQLSVACHLFVRYLMCPFMLCMY